MIYLDNAATTYPKPKKILDQMVEAYAKFGVSPDRGSYDLAGSARAQIHQTRIKVARFFNAPDPDRVVFTANATDGLNTALSGLLQAGDHVVTTRLEHNSVLRPLYHLQQTRQVSSTIVPFTPPGFIDPDRIARAIRPETKLVVVTHASNVLGTLQPVSRIGEICAGSGIPLLVDISQSAGQVRIDMAGMKASALVFTGHKSLYAPSGIGGLIVHPDLDIPPTRFGGTGIESKSMIHTREFPHRLEAGTHNLMGILGLSFALDYLLEQGLESIREKGKRLFQRLLERVGEIRGIQLYGPRDPERCLAVLTLNLQGMPPEDLGAILDADFDVAVRVGLHCAPLVHEDIGTGDRGAVRFSMGHFNTGAEIDRVAAALKQIAETL